MLSGVIPGKNRGENPSKTVPETKKDARGGRKRFASLSRRRRTANLIHRSGNIQFRRFIQMFRHIFPVFLPLPHTFRQEILDLAIDGTEIILRPRGDGVVQFGGQPQRDLFFLIIRHISTDCPSLRPAGRPGCRRAQPEDWRPSPLSAPRPVLPHDFCSAAPGPSPPCPPLRRRSSSGRR